MTVSKRWSIAAGIAAALAVTLGSAALPAYAVGTSSVTRPVISVPVPDLPYHIEARQHFRAGADVAMFEPTHSLLHVQLPASFLAATPTTVNWTIGGVPGASGSATVDAALESVDIPVSPSVADYSAGHSRLQVNLRTSSEPPADIPQPPQHAVLGRPTGLPTPLWQAEADIDIRIDHTTPPPTPTSSTLDVPVSDYAADDLVQNTFFWATAPDAVVVTPSTMIEFGSGRPIWSNERNLPPYGAIDPAWASGGPGSHPSDFEPTFSDDHTFMTVDFSSRPDVLQPYLAGYGPAVVSAGTGTQFETVLVSLLTKVGSDTTVPGIQTTRLAGADRYSGATLTSRFAYPDGASTLYVASGLNFPDALSAGAAAVANSAPLILTAPHVFINPFYLPNLHFSTIVVVGGADSVSDDEINAILSDAQVDPSHVIIRRDGGADRFAASRAVAAGEFPDGADTAFLATGATFSDALSSVSAASTVHAPVILIRGDQSSLDGETQNLLATLGVRHVVLTGGPASISTDIERQLDGLYPDEVVRFGGANRYEVSNAVNSAYFPQASSVYLATGEKFADALSGGVLAGATGSPLMLSHSDCVEPSTIDVLRAQGASVVTLIGGVESLRPPVQALTSCG